MSATKLTASVTEATSSGRIESMRKMGRIGVASDDVPEEPERIVVGPLDVVDEERHGLDPGKRGDRDSGEIERPEKLRIGRHRLETRFVASGDRFDDAPDGDLGRRPGGYVVDRLGGEEAAGDEERPADLLVGRDRDTREPACGRKLERRDQQPRLADPRLSLERHGREAIGSLPQPVGDGVEFGTPADDRAGRAPHVHRERTLRSDDGVESTPVARESGDASSIDVDSPNIRGLWHRGVHDRRPRHRATPAQTPSRGLRHQLASRS